MLKRAPAGRSLHRLDVSPAERPTSGKIPPPIGCFRTLGCLQTGRSPPPVTGGIRTLENLVDSTDAEYEEDRPEKQFLRKLQWMWE